MHGIDKAQIFMRYQDAIQTYILEQENMAAESLARHRPFSAAQKVYKVMILGIGPKWTLQGTGHKLDRWNKLVDATCKKYGITKQTEMDPELLAEANIWMIDQMKDMLE